MIEFRNVTKYYPIRKGRSMIFENLDLTIRPGEHIGIIGRNGAGKSTLVRLMSGAEAPSSGTIRRTMRVSWPLGFSGGFQTGLTGFDNIRFICRIYDLDFDEKIRYVEEFSGLKEYLREPMKVYSAGMRARLAFAASMIVDFDCYLIDEIVAVGDVAFQEKSKAELLTKSDKALVIVSHDHAFLRDNCDSFILLTGNGEGHNALIRYDDFEDAYYHYCRLLGLI